MDQELDQPPLRSDPDLREVDRPEAEPVGGTREAVARPKEYFSVRLTHSGTSQEFEDPRLAGAAFFQADPTERPSVTHVDGNTARTMARTEVHGQHETGEPRTFKSLPDSHAPDASFREGFLQAMEASLTERLDKLDFAKSEENVVERLDAGLRDDLEAFARREPGKAAALWAERTDEPAPGPILQEAVQSREVEANAQVAAYQDALEENPPVIATGDWVTTDRDVDLRPVAVATERGVHAGYEAKLPGGESEISFSDRTFANSREALRHAWDFYEGGDEGLEIAVKRAAEMDRTSEEEPDRVPTGLVLEHREQPEFPRPETAIYAGEDAQLVLTLGRETESTRSLAEKLVADPEFRKLVAEHIPDAETTLGPGRFEDGQGFQFLPDEQLVVTSYGRDGGAEVLAKFPDEGPLSEALARHLTTSPVVETHLAEERERTAFREDPAKAISDWIEASSAQIDRLPPNRQGDLRAEMEGIAKEAAAAFGVDQERALADAPPRSTLYSTRLTASALTVGAETTDLNPTTVADLKVGLQLTANEAGIDGAKLAKRLETGAANAREEEAWVKSDIAEVAARHGLDTGDDKARSRAVELVDRFYEKAAERIHAARAAELAREQNPLLEALGTMAKVHGHQGSAAFRTEDQARDFAEEMKGRYGASVLKDIAAGRTDALAKDVPDPAARQAMAAAVVSAAKEHPSLGLSAHEAEAAERKLAAEAQRTDRPQDHARDRNRAQNHDREF
jgi:hypothetical protein